MGEFSGLQFFTIRICAGCWSEIFFTDQVPVLKPGKHKQCQCTEGVSGLPQFHSTEIYFLNFFFTFLTSSCCITTCFFSRESLFREIHLVVVVNSFTAFNLCVLMPSSKHTQGPHQLIFGDMSTHVSLPLQNKSVVDDSGWHMKKWNKRKWRCRKLWYTLRAFMVVQ